MTRKRGRNGGAENKADVEAKAGKRNMKMQSIRKRNGNRMSMRHMHGNP